MLRRFHYAWVIAGLTFLILVVTAGVRSAPGVLMVPLQDAMHWTRADISAAVAVNILVLGMMGPFSAALMDKFGLRRAMVGSLLLMGLGMAATPWVTTVWMLVLLWGVVIGIGAGMTFMVLGATVASNWFTRHRGLMTGLISTGTAGGHLLFLPLLTQINQHLGWQTVTWVAGGVAMATAIPVALLIRDRPADMGLAPFGALALAPPRRTEGNPFARSWGALRTASGHRDFWLIGYTFFVCGASTSGLITTHLIPACIDAGLSPMAGADTLAAMGLFTILGTTISGWLSDRMDSRLLLVWFFGLRAVSLVFLPFAFHYGVWGLGAWAVFYGLDWIATVPPIVRLVAREFGDGNVGLYFGWIAAGHQLGGASIAWLAGLMRTVSGDYVGSFLFSGLLCLTAVLAITYIGGRTEQTAAAPA